MSYLFDRVDFRFHIKTKAGEESGHRFIAGYASTADLDREDEIITEEALKKAAKHLMTNSTVFYEHKHSDLPIGRVVESRYSSAHKGIYIKVYISKTADEVWTLIQEGILNHFSIGGKVLGTDEIMDEKLGKKVILVTELDLYEVSVVGLPANPKAIITSVSKAIFKALHTKKTKESETVGGAKKMAENKLKKEVKEPVAKKEVKPVEKKVEKKEEPKVEEKVKKTPIENKPEVKKEEIKPEVKKVEKVEEKKPEVKEEKKPEVKKEIKPEVKKEEIEDIDVEQLLEKELKEKEAEANILKTVLDKVEDISKKVNALTDGLLKKAVTKKEEKKPEVKKEETPVEKKPEAKKVEKKVETKPVEKKVEKAERKGTVSEEKGETESLEGLLAGKTPEEILNDGELLKKLDNDTIEEIKNLYKKNLFLR